MCRMLDALYKPIFLGLSLLLMGGHLQGAVETREYDITVAGFNIGEMIATCETHADDPIRRYTLKSKVSFWFFVRVNVEYTVSSVYRDDHLITSSVITKSNRGDFKSVIQWSVDHYDVRVDGYKYKNDAPIADSIAYNSARMYFEYPPGSGRILADNYGVMVPTRMIQKDVYGVTVDGNTNRFFFKNGKVIRAVMHHSIKNFEVTLKT